MGNGAGKSGILGEDLKGGQDSGRGFWGTRLWEGRIGLWAGVGAEVTGEQGSVGALEKQVLGEAPGTGNGAGCLGLRGSVHPQFPPKGAGNLGTACPPRPSPRSHAHVPTLHPRPGGAAVPRPPGHEEARVRRGAMERLRGQGAARGEHRGGCPQVRDTAGAQMELLDHGQWAAGRGIMAHLVSDTQVLPAVVTHL